ncbi:MAG: S46 family peptidase, partial [Bacteroidales bacterium]|nr:S46 family peptidase [Bacteroidales bacterium]
GFWAMSKEEELRNPGLEARILIRMEDVTQEILEGVAENMSEQTRNMTIAANSKKIIEQATASNHYQGTVSPLFNGNQFFLYVYEVFKDIRLVGAPPSAIGKFGGDTDNWMWPRHTGDFSVFRIYAGPDNKPAEYSKDNVPYKPKAFLELSLQGYKPGDFTMVYGYPYTTTEYLPSFAVEMLQDKIYPASVDIRTAELEIIDQVMERDPALRIMYAGRQAGIANGWKKWRGVIKGLEKSDVVLMKQIHEREFLNAVAETRALKNRYGGLIKEYQKQYNVLSPLKRWENIFMETLWRNGFFQTLYKAYPLSIDAGSPESNTPALCENIIARGKSYFKTMDIDTEKEILAMMLKKFVALIPTEEMPPLIDEINKKYNGDFNRFVDKAFKKSVFASPEKMEKFFSSYKQKHFKKLKKDPLYALMTDVTNFYIINYHQPIAPINVTIDSLDRIYMEGMLTVMPESVPYPDANATLRITHGVVESYFPADGIRYTCQTTLDGIIEKDNPDIYDYSVPEKLKQLHTNKDYGRYAVNGTVPVAFIASNHTTGGNSGSPILDAHGRLIGINFDRAWEGTMSDIHYDPDICRNISVDVRYILFIIDKYAGATHLINELSIIE